MDNDNKIDNEYLSESKEVSLFLAEELIPLKKRKVVTTYNLENEYAKTKKNHNISIWIIMTLTIAVVCLTTMGIVSSMTEKNENVRVSLNTFEDLNMRNLFDALSKTQDLYEKASKAKAELQASFDNRMAHAKRIRDVDIENLKKMKLSKKQRQEKEAAIRSTFNKTINKIHTDLDEQLKAAEIELKQYEEQLKSFDSENIEKAQTWEKEMDSQRQVHEIEKNKLTEEYENMLSEMKKQMLDNQEHSYQERKTAVNDLTNHYEAIIAKLDPVIKDSSVTDAIENNAGLAAGTNLSLEAVTQNVTFTDEVYDNELSELKRKYDQYAVLNSILQKIPFANGMAKVVDTENQLIYNMTYSIAKTGAERISKLKADNSHLSISLDKSRTEASRYKDSMSTTYTLLDSYAKSIKADGFVLSADSGSNTVLFISSNVRNSIKNDGSTTAVILDSHNKKIASGAIWFKDSVYYLSFDQETVIIPNGAVVKINK